MRNHLRLPTLAFLVMLVATACSWRDARRRRPHRPAARPRRPPPSRRARRPPSRRPREAAAPTPEPAADCAQSTADNAMEMWERSGGNKGMVDHARLRLERRRTRTSRSTCRTSRTPRWSARSPSGIATGDVPDLMGMDLIYAPQFENAGQLVDITDQITAWPELTTASPGHMTVATFKDRLYGVPLYADVSALFYNKDLFTKAGLDPNKPPTSLAELREYADKITALGGDIEGLLPARQLRGLQHLHRRAADVGVRGDDRGRQVRRRAARSATASRKCSSSPATWSRRATSRPVPRPRTARPSTSSSAPASSGMMGTGNFNITLARDQMKDHDVRSSASACCRAWSRARPPRSSAATWSSSRTAASASTTPSTFMKFLLSDDEPGRGLRQGAQPHDPLRHGRQQVLPGRAARPGRGQGPRAVGPDAVHR